ncbi:acyl-CoA carboxylase epsilon subunit [Streptomyces sp. NPDC058985]|uniref:acyl-CoA carboxylase epsilon subunit n=1 Tax=Streptomyces sp. NPDC058985 TaxID=3346684 RepID=UPI0036C2D661
MSTPLTVVRGNPTPEELAAVLVVLAAVRPEAERPDRATTARRWGRPACWRSPQAAYVPDMDGWQRTPTHERSTR